MGTEELARYSRLAAYAEQNIHMKSTTSLKCLSSCSIQQLQPASWLQHMQWQELRDHELCQSMLMD